MKTINGKSTERIGDRIDFYPEGSTTEPFLPTAPATLIQWDGPPQRVLTVDEAMEVVLPYLYGEKAWSKDILREALAKSAKP